jgi:hypothetical protein
VEEGHQQLLDWIQRWIDGLEDKRTTQLEVAPTSRP